MPNFPNYRLGALQGSPSDTLGVSTIAYPQATPRFVLYPNPTSGLLNLEWKHAAPDRIVIHDLMGRPVLAKSVSTASASLNQMDLNSLANGVYLVSVWQDGGVVFQEKVVVQH